MDADLVTNAAVGPGRTTALARRVITRILVGLAFLSVLGLAIPTSNAFADYKITKPSNPYVFALNSSNNPVPFDVQSTGWRFHQLVFIEICDGKPATAVGWTPGVDCDNETSPSPVAATSTGTVTFPANNSNFAIVTFHGASPNGVFDCISKNEVPSDAVAKTDRDTSGRQFTYYALTRKDTKTSDGVPLSPSTRAWTDCQLRVASNYASATNDQQFITLQWPVIKNPSGGSGASAAAYAAIGVVALLLLAGSGYFLLRRRRASPF